MHYANHSCGLDILMHSNMGEVLMSQSVGETEEKEEEIIIQNAANVCEFLEKKKSYKCVQTSMHSIFCL